MKVKYRRSVFGYIWTLLVPVTQVLFFYFLYKIILKVPIENYLNCIFVSVFSWYFVSGTVAESLECLVAGQALLTQVPVPIQAFPASSVLTNFLNFVFSWPIIGIALIALNHNFALTNLWFFPLAGILFIFTYSFAYLIATMYVVLRDTRHIFGITMQFWMYITPILYPQEMVPDQYKWVLKFNPVAGFFINLRKTVVQSGDLDSFWLMHFFGATVIVLCVALFVNVKFGKSLVERL